MFIKWIKSLFQKKHTELKAPENPNERDFDDPSYAATQLAFDNYWNKIGNVEANFISYIISPGFLGAAPWPTTRQSFRIIRTPNSLIIASNGLSDPFEEDKNLKVNGFEMEVFIEIIGLQGLSYEDIQKTPAFALIEQVARQVADWGGITQLLDQINVASSEIPISSDTIPEAFLTSNGCVGVLFGMIAKGRPKFIPDTPLSPVRMVPVTVLTPEEVAEVAKSKAARDRMAKHLRDTGIKHASDFQRKSMI